nr:ubiquitin-conjugating enzyme E2 T-like isoform X1 [Rhipicephalus microplus]
MLRNVRIQRELAMLNSELPPGIVCNPVADMLDTFEAVITGANGTPYEGGIFKLNIRIPERYPFEAPVAVFKTEIQGTIFRYPFEAPVAVFQTPVYHPNVDSTGRICLDVLQMPPKGRWRPSLNLKVVLLSLHALLAQPNPDDPLVPELADQFKYQRDMFNRLAAEHTRRHAMS